MKFPLCFTPSPLARTSFSHMKHPPRSFSLFSHSSVFPSLSSSLHYFFPSPSSCKLFIVSILLSIFFPDDGFSPFSTSPFLLRKKKTKKERKETERTESRNPVRFTKRAISIDSRSCFDLSVCPLFPVTFLAATVIGTNRVKGDKHSHFTKGGNPHRPNQKGFTKMNLNRQLEIEIGLFKHGRS